MILSRSPELAWTSTGKVRMTNARTGDIRHGVFGFSWTSLLFGGFTPLLRGDVAAGLILIAIAATAGFFSGGVLWFAVNLIPAATYNDIYTRGLLCRGFEFDDTPETVAAAKEALRLTDPQPDASHDPMTLFFGHP